MSDHTPEPIPESVEKIREIADRISRNSIPEGYASAGKGLSAGGQQASFGTITKGLEELTKRLTVTKDKAEAVRRQLCGELNVATMPEPGASGKRATPGSIFDQLAVQILALVKLQAELDAALNQSSEALR